MVTVTLQPGDPLPDLTLTGVGGAPVPLASFAGEHVLLIFLRHLA